MNPKLILPALATLLPVSSEAATTLYAEYHLGETGSLGASNRPLDSSGNGRNMAQEISGAAATVASAGVYAATSTDYLSTAGAGNEGWYSSGLFTTLPTDNFAFGVFARAASNTAATQGDVFTVGGSNGSFKLSLATNGWAASAHNIAWIAATNGVAGSFAADTWVHLALIRSGGTTTFYINGTAQGSTYGGAPVHDTPHLSVAPGGATFFDGNIDEARVVTFTSGESATNVLNTLQGVPEPASALLGGLGLLGLLRRHRVS